MQCAETDRKSRAVAVGASAAGDAQAAGFDAALTALSDLGTAAEAKLLVVFSSPRLASLRVLEGVAEAAGATPSIGCTTAGEISSAGPSESSVVVFVLGGDGFSVATGAAVGRDAGLRSAATEASRCLDGLEVRRHTALLVLSDGLAGDQQEVVRGAYAQVGAEVPLVGGCAGDDLRMERTEVFRDGEALRGAVVTAAISSDAPLGIGVSHGWRRVGPPMLVSASHGPVVEALDDRPALDVYLDALDAPPSARADQEAFTTFASTRPLGLARRAREEVRFVASADFTRRSLICLAEVPQGASCWSMTGDVESVLAATDQACASALDSLGGHPPVGMLVFDCIARKQMLGRAGIAEEVSRMAALSGGVPLAGFYSYGEIARTVGPSGFHNQTLVALAVS